MSSKGRPRRGPCYVSVAYTHAATDPRVRRHCGTVARQHWVVYQVGLAAPSESQVGRLGRVILIRSPQGRYRGGSLWRYAVGYLEFMVWARRILRRLARRRQVDVVHVNNVPNSIIWVAAGARRRGAKVILDLHDPVPELFASKFEDTWGARWVVRLLELEERWAARRADAVLCVNAVHRELCERHGVPPSNLRVVMNRAEAGLFPVGPARLPGGMIVYHGTVARRMGLDVVLRALDLLCREGREVRGAIWGDGDAVPFLRRVRDGLGLTAVVDIPGRRFRLEDLKAKLGAAGVGVVPLQRDSFTDVGLPTKLLELVRLGIPAVATWTPTIARYFPEDTVEYVRDFTPRGVAAALARVLDAPEAARARAARAQRLPVAGSWQEHESELTTLLAELTPIERTA